MSQDQLGQGIGVTFQQIQKYESGANRISASRLYELARVLDIPISFFFDDLPSRSVGSSASVPTDDANVMLRRETLEWVRAYYAIPAAPARDAVYRLIKSMANLAKASRSGT
jgi:transcriptional regulator with XRE-family HTH domain